jgi:hypothetical protein
MFASRWLIVVLASIVASAGMTRSADALDPNQREKMQRHFASLGTVKYELFAPLGGQDVGAVLLQGSSGDELRVVKLQPGGGFSTVYSGPVSSAGVSGRQPFTFLMAGKHLLIYSTRIYEGLGPLKSEIGDLSVFDLTGEGAARLIFSLSGVADLGVQPSSSLSQDSILRQPSRHFLNRSGRLPVKYDYYRLSFDQEAGQYRIFNHLTPLTSADVDEAANLNNRAIADYYSGRLMDASRGLERAAIVVERNQTTVYRNQNLVKSEIDDLAAQGRLVRSLPNDDALLAFWQGDYFLVTRLLEMRQAANLSATDYAMLGLAFAHQRRWPEADQQTSRLAKLNYPEIGDYCTELVKIAEYQKLPQVVEIQLRALEYLAPAHPGLTAALARVLLRASQPAQAEALLSSYLNRESGSSRDLAPARLELFSIYHASNNQTGMERLIRDELSSHSGSLRCFVAMADYIDSSLAYVDVVEADRQRLKAPTKPLDYLGEVPPSYTQP